MGDFIVFEEAFTAQYDPSAKLDIVLEITGIDLNSSNPQVATGSGGLRLNNNSVAFNPFNMAADSYVTFRMLPLKSGSITGAVSTGTVVLIESATFAQLDRDCYINLRDDSLSRAADANAPKTTIQTPSFSIIDHFIRCTDVSAITALISGCRRSPCRVRR